MGACKSEHGWELVKKPLNWDSKVTMELISGSIDCIGNGDLPMNGREVDYTFSPPYVDYSQVDCCGRKNPVLIPAARESCVRASREPQSVYQLSKRAALDLAARVAKKKACLKKLADTFGRF